MIELERLEQELSEKEKIFDEKYISGKGDYLSEEAEKMRQDIWRLRSKITDLKEKKEKTADELFEELGYEKVRDDERFIKYRKPHDNDYIVIDKETKDFIKNFDFAYWKAFNMQELQAINKKCQELGWLD